MKLELKHLADYLPYGVKVTNIHILNIGNGIGSLSHLLTTKNDQYKLILRPLSDLTKEIKVNEETFIPMVYLFMNFCKVHPDKYSLDIGKTIILMDVQHEFNEWYFVYHIKEKLFEFSNKRETAYRNLNQYEMFELLKSWHFDIFGLIDAGLAVDINSVKF